MKFEPLSGLTNFTKPVLEINLRNDNRNASVDVSRESSNCTARVVRQVDNTPYLFTDAGFNRVRLEDFMRRMVSH